jgi:pimeloyl-ACP methyl ester carboxylesterase
LRGLGHTVIHYSQDGNQDVAEKPLQQFEDLIVPYIRDTVLQGPLSEKKVTVLAHSRGGILIRYYLARNPDAGSEWIGRVITLHSPHSGTLAPEAKRRLASWVTLNLLGPDPITFLAGQLVLTLIDSLTDWLDSTPGQSQLLPGDPLFDRLSTPGDTPSIDFQTFGGSSVTMSPIYLWEWAPSSYFHNIFDFPDIRYDWTQVPAPLIPVPLLDLIPNDAVFPEEWEGRGDIAVTVDSSALADSNHRNLPINHAEALFDERIFSIVAERLDTPLGSTEVIGCGMGFLGNSRTMELHSLEFQTRQCQIAEIVEPEFFDAPDSALESGYDGCFYCMRAEHTPES